MDNANKALIIAGSTLIAVILLTMFITFIEKLSIWPETEDEIKNTEQITAFNKEYEVYQKSAMYGVDVISCLNKAKSNNEKYVDGGSFLGEKGYGKNYEINVTVQIKTPLTETITVTAIQPVYNGYKETSIYDTNSNVEKYNRADLKLKDVFDIDETKQLTNFKKNDNLKYSMTKTNSEFSINTKYQLVDDSVSIEDNLIEKLLAHSNTMKQIIKNPEKPSNFTYDPSLAIPSYGWSTATWSTYLYSFKQKRFKCTNLEYSSKTGRVNKLEFEEI